MKEQLISLLVSKVGIEQAKADQAVETILGYIKQNPQELSSYLEKAGVEGIGKKLGLG
ncbi:MAG TPA: hypothetical protein VNO14_11565 [Blastocatellia bacterium]|nr:hypothetical protein [Blastocatellia bacterium]